MWRPRCWWWSGWRAGGPSGSEERRLGLPHLLHDHPCQLHGLVVGGDARVDDVGGQEAYVPVPGRILGLEDDLGLAPGGQAAVVGVDDHDVEEVAADVLVDDPQVVADRVALGLARLLGNVADEDLDRWR